MQRQCRCAQAVIPLYNLLVNNQLWFLVDVAAMSAEAEKTGVAAQENGPTDSVDSRGDGQAQTSEPQTEESATSNADERSTSDELGSILSMNVPVIVKVAQKKMLIADVLKLDLGAVIQFETDAYQHVDLMINNHTIGRGQPVKVGENFGLRIVEIGKVTDTIRSLAGPSGRRQADDSSS